MYLFIFIMQIYLLISFLNYLYFDQNTYYSVLLKQEFDDSLHNAVADIPVGYGLERETKTESAIVSSIVGNCGTLASVSVREAAVGR